jgi:hypothetical protein
LYIYFLLELYSVDDDDEDDGKEASPSTFKQASTSDVNLD